VPLGEAWRGLIWAENSRKHCSAVFAEAFSFMRLSLGLAWPGGAGPGMARRGMAGFALG